MPYIKPGDIMSNLVSSLVTNLDNERFVPSSSQANEYFGQGF